MNNKTIVKACFGIATFAALSMAIGKFAASFSQNDITDYSWLLTIYLGFGAMGFMVLAIDSFNRNDLVRILWLFKIQWGYVYLWLAFSFIAVDATNVSQFYLPHIISTASVFVGSGALPMYLKKWYRVVGYVLWAGAVFYFYQTFANGLHTIAWGEMAVTLVAVTITWIIINEQIKK